MNKSYSRSPALRGEITRPARPADRPAAASLFKRLANAALNALALGVFLALFFTAYGSLNNRWYHVLYVYSGSMAPTFQAGDLIIITPPPETIQPGMILTLQVDDQLVTHRVVAVAADGALQTQGDANLAPDNWGNARITIRGLYRGHLPYLGYLVSVPRELVTIFEKSVARVEANFQGYFR